MVVNVAADTLDCVIEHFSASYLCAVAPVYCVHQHCFDPKELPGSGDCKIKGL